MKYGLSDAQFDEVIHILSTYPEIKEAVLFGSRALGTFKEASDVDIALKGKRVTAALAAKLKFHLEEETYQPFFYDFIAYPTITNEALRKHIDENGVCIYRKGWREYTLGDTGKVITGKTPSKYNPEDWGNNVLFITPSDYKNYRKKAYDSIRMLSQIGVERQKNRLLPPGSVLVTCIGSDMGKSVVNAFPCVTDQQINAIIPNESIVNKDYLYYLALDLYEILRGFGGDGTAVPILNKTDFENIDVTLPPLPEQKAIASVLSSLDNKIDLLLRQNKTIEAMAETLFRQLFMVEAQEDWKEGKIQDLFLLQRGYDLPAQKRLPGSYPILSASGPCGYLNNSKVKAPGVTTGRSGLLGKVFYVMEDFWPLNTSLFIKEYRTATPLFAYFFLKNMDLESFNAGSAVPTLNRNHVHEHNISVPPKELIHHFEKLMLPVFDRIHSNKYQIQTLEKLRNLLLPKLISGEVRVAYNEN